MSTQTEHNETRNHRAATNTDQTDAVRTDAGQNDNSNRIKDPDDWTTGDQPMTGAQQSYLHTLSDEAGVRVEDDLTKAEASKRIDELQEQTGRGNN